jgi:alpha-amylase/alpha-mannosidase (GH57 family)
VSDTERCICVHGHFYQPPRENAWLEAIELQDSASPYHDWNERITAECYAPNAASRILDGDGRIVEIVNNYARISFDFGPTLLAWMEEGAPEVHETVVAADRASRERFSGHGSALAQAYNHVIMPLATHRDKVTQVRWGLRDFARRFGRDPEGMWLPETAVDMETLEVLAEYGIAFTVLAPRQARRVRPLRAGARAWRDVSNERIDPSRAYLQHLPSGRSIALFFYDGPISRGVAFEGVLNRGEDLAGRLVGAFSADRDWPQLVHIATDGETYGHHHRHGEMALSYALHHIESNGLACLTNYAEFLERHPPEQEVDIFENSSWSCVHGVERWRADCGCNTGQHGGWSQAWRAPLRAALDWLRDAVGPRYEEAAGVLLRDPWAARDAYIDVVIDRSPETVQRFLAAHQAGTLDHKARVRTLQLLELQRHAMLMFTSCGWFFDELSGIETVQVIQYAGRVVQLAHTLFDDDPEEEFLRRLAQAPSNLPAHADGRHIYETLVRPAEVGLADVGAHYALSSLFEGYGERERLFCYAVEREDRAEMEAGQAHLGLGRVRVTSEITGESALLTYGALHFGDHTLSGGVREYGGEGTYRTMIDEVGEAFGRVDFAETLRRLDAHLGKATYSLRSLFRDEQREITARVLEPTLADIEAAYRRIYRNNASLMRFLAELGMPQPSAFRSAGEFVLNVDLRRELGKQELDLERVETLVEEARAARLELDASGLGFVLQGTLERMMERLARSPGPPDMTGLKAVVAEALTLPFDVHLWRLQNLFYAMLHSLYPAVAEQAAAGDTDAATWTEAFATLGERLRVRVG